MLKDVQLVYKDSQNGIARGVKAQTVSVDDSSSLADIQTNTGKKIIGMDCDGTSQTLIMDRALNSYFNPNTPSPAVTLYYGQ